MAKQLTEKALRFLHRKPNVPRSLSNNRNQPHTILSAQTTYAGNVSKFVNKIPNMSYLYRLYSTAESDSLKTNRVEDMDLSKIENPMDRILDRLDFLMDMMEVERAVRLIRKSAKIEIIPPKETLLNLIQQTANLGEYATLLDLYRLIKNEDMFSSSEFFHQLQMAYFNTQRIEEAVTMLRMIYHGVRKYDEVDLLFTSICMMILRHFPAHINLVRAFVDDCIFASDRQKNFRPAAGLWKCYILNEDFERAAEVLDISESVLEFVPDMVDDILTGKNNIDFNRAVVLCNVYQMTLLPITEEQRCAVLSECLRELCKYIQTNRRRSDSVL